MLQSTILGDDTKSNLTSAISNEASISSSNKRSQELYSSTMHPHQGQQSFVSENNRTRAPPAKKKRNLPGNPDPEAEVVALSPQSLMATNRFVCEICNKGFQRDQNLQLHRRGHNLPWKLKTRSNKDVIKKKVYVCPEPSCAHHEPSRALGDLTGIKKHFSRKHGEKKWKCEKCSKRYAVQSDWKAHSKICGTREYRCDCGTLFSRRDSFITHRAFCDALAQESTQTLTNFPPWLSPEAGAPGPNNQTSSQQLVLQNPTPSNTSIMSATALLQKATLMGAKMSMGAQGFCAPTLSDYSTTAGLNSVHSREEINGTGLLQGFLSAFGHKVEVDNSGCMEVMNNNHGVNMVVSSNSNLAHHAISGSSSNNNNGFTRDFLGLRAFPHQDFVDIVGLDRMRPSQVQDQGKWHMQNY